MKILTILGTRPEIIRLSRIIPKLDRFFDHMILHTGQNYTNTLNTIFFEQLGIRSPDISISNNVNSFSSQLSNIFMGVERCLEQFKPDKVLILGDTNSGLSALLCERMNIPVYHMEAGNRCYDLSVPEEKNRLLIDKISSVNIPYTKFSRDNLIRDNIHPENIFISGNPIYEVLNYYQKDIDASDILNKFNLKRNEYIVATSHRAENVDSIENLTNIVTALNEISKKHKVFFSCHPRTKNNIDKFNILLNNHVIVSEPLGFFDFVNLEKNSKLAITDSGTVQEEMCILGIPTVTIRNTTERPETIWCGSNTIAGLKSENILNSIEIMFSNNKGWEIPDGYSTKNVSDIILNIIGGK